MSLSDQMELPYSVASDRSLQADNWSSHGRTPKNKANPFTKISNRLLNCNRQLAGLKRGDVEIHTMLLSCRDDHGFEHLPGWIANRFHVSKRTAHRIIDRLVCAGLLLRVFYTKEWINGYVVLEEPCDDHPADPVEARKPIIVQSIKGCHRRQLRAPGMPQTFHGNLVVKNHHPAFSCPKGGVTRVSRLTTTHGDVLHSSEHPSTPKSPAERRGPSFSERLREEAQYSRITTPTRRAKRRKGRQAPIAPKRRRKSAQPARNPQRAADADSPVNSGLGRLLGRAAISGWRSSVKADITGFLANLDDASFNRAFAHLAEHRLTWRYEKSLKALQDNPLLGIAQRLLGLVSWTQQQLRRVLQHGDSIWKDIIMLDYGRRVGALHSSALREVRDRILSSNPRKAEFHKGLCQHYDFMGHDGLYHQWESWVDSCKIHARDALAVAANGVVLDESPDVEAIDAQLDRQVFHIPGRWSAVGACCSTKLSSRGQAFVDLGSGREPAVCLCFLSDYRISDYWMPA